MQHQFLSSTHFSTGRIPNAKHITTSSIYRDEFPSISPLGGDSISRPCIPVQTKKGFTHFHRPIPDNPCSQCSGTGRVVCGECMGKGRLNFKDSPMLPKGVVPQWCPSCRACGRWFCPACMGTGKKRDPIGFRI
jgi:hypothetical protein